MRWLAMSQKVEAHATIENKFQCAVCDYGHDDPKSRQMIYKHWNKEHKETVPSAGETDVHFPSPSDSGSIPVEEDTSSVQWDQIEWLNDPEDSTIPHTIPAPIREMANSKSTKALTKAQKNMERAAVRWSFIGLDRLISWWGKGVMSKPAYEIQRSQKDYDVLQESTVGLMESYGITIPASPIMIWGTIVGSAYVPPIMHIRKNADPNRKRRFKIPIIGRILQRRQKRKASKLNPEVIVNEQFEP